MRSDPLKRAAWLAALLSLAACAADHAAHTTIRDSGIDDARADELTLLMTRIVRNYDRAVSLNCPCFVEMGAYTSIDECTLWQSSRPEWVPCATDALEAVDPNRARLATECYGDRLAKYADCLVTAACDTDARTACDTKPLGCLTEGAADIGVALSSHCPDIALLQRMGTP